MTTRTKVPSDETVEAALQDIQEAAHALTSPWALIGGLALRAYGVPRETLDADLFTEPERLERFAGWLVDHRGWIPLRDDPNGYGTYVETDEVTTLFMEDPVLMDLPTERQMIALRAPSVDERPALTVEILAAQHPIEQEMLERSAYQTYLIPNVPIAPLGGILLVKAKADRKKDQAAIEQAIEHLAPIAINAAIQWATKRDARTGEDLHAIAEEVRRRRTPNRRTRRGS